MERMNLAADKNFIRESVLYENPATHTRLETVVDTGLNRTVVLKTISFENADQKERILGEIRNQTALERYTDFTPKIYNVFVDNKGKKIIMEMQKIEGKTLREIIDENASAERDRQWFDRTHDLLLQVCNSVGMIHRAKHPAFVHKDLKPENIMVNRDRNAVYIIDFSISGPGLERGIGTPAYMAPEQHRNMRQYHVSQATDIFALGQIGIEMFTGTPLEYNTDLVVDTGIGKDKWLTEKDISDIGSPFDPELGRILKKAIAMNPEDRYADGRAMTEALRGSRGRKHGRR